MLKHLINLFSSLLLLSLSTAYATPPPTPILNVQTQGLNVEAEWFATGATGYRLFYAYTNNGQVEVADMGSMNQISAVMEHGTAMSLYVQAYNADGDSPYSEVKTFVIHDPTADKSPEMLQPDVQNLTFQAVFLDTPVAFLPTREDAEAQDRAVRSSSNKESSYGPEFEEGRIGMTVHIAPALVWRDSLQLSLCLSVADTCEPLLVWNSERHGYAKTITIYDLPNDVEKSVYLELLMPKALVEKLRGQDTKEQEYVVYASEVNSRNPATQMVTVAKIPVVDLGERSTRSTRGTSSLKITTPQFGKDFSNSMFGVGFQVTPQLWIYKTYGTTGTDKKTGAQLGATGTMKATVLGNSFDVMSIEGYATKNSGKRLTKRVAVNVLGQSIYSTKQSKRSGQPAQVTTVSNTAPQTPSNWQDCSVNGIADATAQCSEPPPSDGADAESGGDGDENSPQSNIFSYTKEVKKGYSQVFVLVFVPVRLEAGISGNVTLNVGAGVEITISPIGLKVTGGGGPSAGIGSYAQAGVTILIASAGVEANFNLISNTLLLNAVANTSISPLDLKFGGAVINQLNGPRGDIALVASYKVPAWSLPPWRTKTVRKTLVSWSTFNYEFTLLKWGNDGSEQPNDAATLNSKAASAGGEYIPVFTDQEPTSADGPMWVCVYANVTHNAPRMDGSGVPLSCYDDGFYVAGNYITEQQVARACTQMPASTDNAKYEEVGFDISTMSKDKVSHKSKCPPGSPGANLANDPKFDWMYVEDWSNFQNAVTAIKIWGPLRVGLFEGVNRTGSSAYWYANTGEVESVDLNQVPANYMIGKSGSLLMTRIGVQDANRYPSASRSTVNACFYQNSDKGGANFCLPFNDGTKPLNASDNKGAKFSVNNDKVNYVGSWWNDTISSVSLAGYGLVCAFADENFKGYDSCYLGKGTEFRFNLTGMNDKISSLWVDLYPYLVLVDDMNGSLEQNGTSSLPNSTLLSSGPLSGLYSSGVNQMNRVNSATVAGIRGPRTVILHANSAMNGKRSMFFLDDDEWDATYLNGINDDVEAFNFWGVNCNVSGC